MELRDQATLALRIESNEFDRKLGELNEKAKVLRSTLKDIERDGGKGSEEWAKYKQELKETEAAAKKLGTELRQMDIGSMTMQQLSNHAKQLERDLKNAERGTIEYANTAKRLGEVEREMKKATDETMKLKGAGEDLAKPTLWQKISSGIGTVGGAMKALMALQVIGYIVEIGKTIFEATAKMEKFEKVLSTALGDQTLAKESLAAIKQMAKDTVFTVEELTEGYVKMVNRGIRPSKDEMTALADLAASQGKTFDQLVEAALDAQTGEMERLKEFGIRAKKSGDEVTLSFKGMNQTVKNTPEAINAALISFGQMNGVAGQNAEMMTTLDGRTSNLQDSFFDLASDLGENLKPAFIGIFDLINALMPVLSILGKVIATVIITGKGLISTFIDTLTSAWKGVNSLYDAGKALLSGNLDEAKKYWEVAKKYGDETAKAAEKNGAETRKQIMAIWSDPDAKVKAEFAGKEQGSAYQSAQTEEQKKGQEERKKAAEKAGKEEKAAAKKLLEEKLEQEKKHLEDVKKANEEAIAEMFALEDEAFVERIKREEGEAKAEIVILQQKLDKQLENLEKSLANEEQKEKLRKLLIEKYIREIAVIEEKARAKKQEDEEKAAEKLLSLKIKQLDNEKKLLKQEEEALKDILRFKELTTGTNLKKLLELRKKHEDDMLDLRKRQIENEKKLEEAKIEREIKDEKERSEALKALAVKYEKELQVIEDESKTKKLKLDEDYYEGKKENFKKWGNALKSLLKGEFDQFSTQMGELGKKNTALMASPEAAAAQKAIEQWVELLDAIGQVAIQAIEYITKLRTLAMEKEIRDIERTWKVREKALNDELEKATQVAEEVQAKRDQIAEEAGEKIITTKEREAAKLKGMEELITEFKKDNSDAERDTKIANAQAVLDAEIAAIEQRADIDATEKANLLAAAQEKHDKEVELAKSEAEEKKTAYTESVNAVLAKAEEERVRKIAEASAIRDAVLYANEWERKEKIIAAEAIRDAQIAAIQKRTDIDEAARAKMIDDVKAAADTEIGKINEVATEKNAQAKATANTAISEAYREKDDKVLLMNAIVAGDKAKADELMAKAKVEADEKIAQAEREKEEKLRKVEEEKAARLVAKQELERLLFEEEKAKKMKIWELETKMFYTQQKADIAMAMIQAGLAAVKTMASVAFPMNLIAAGMVGIQTKMQIDLIKAQEPPEMPEFRHGGMIFGSKHGSSYGKAGIAMIDRRTRREVGEMEGEEYIVPADQTKLNMPFLVEMSRRSRAGIREPLVPGRAFQYGGFVNYPYWERQIFRYGGSKDDAAASMANEATAAALNTIETGDATAVYSASMAQGARQIATLEAIELGVVGMNEKLDILIRNTDANVTATQGVERAVMESNTSSKMDVIIGLISKLSNAA